ncbi:MULTISPECIES: AmmeMemoRadiSam system protein B [Geobacter]|uniref:AmmeMemoRadiSam system protein B n=1 Tax=Geobacter TaxID=28231 RepID=UPI0025737C2F|nr:AmmeMemoRadiSam system protein B [Geobacter sulfurreducens]BEH10175.1 AmmeMemoRadiSam system protein B [Geobacter sulfurreducens subsp. ethanolicus]BET58239.1 AmmeMemoRadiSam system protein B [Geobacter sp. 60473]
MVRQPAVAGQFYTDDPRRLREELGRLIRPVPAPRRVTGVIAPHAGYMYSGAIAGAVYGSITIPRTVVILGPNHHGLGAAASLYPDGRWLSPLGEVPIEQRLSSLILEHVPQAEPDVIAHRFEHSLEVQVPFLRYLNSDVAIVPMCLGDGGYGWCRQVGEGLARAIAAYGEEVLIVASSDMTHYESAESARLKDEAALSCVLALDAEGLLKVCRQRGITMCGVIPSTVMLVAARELGASRAELIRYGTSGDVTGDNRQVVAYAAVAVY